MSSSQTKASLRHSARLLKPHAAPHVGAFIAIILLGGVAAIGSSAVIVLLEPIFDMVLFPDAAAEMQAAAATLPEAAAVDGGFSLKGVFESLREQVIERGWSDDSPNGQRLAVMYIVVAVFLVLAFVAAIAQYFYGRLSGWVSLRMIVDLRVKVTSHLMGLGMHYHGRRQLGDLLSRISADIATTLNAVNLFFKDLSRNFYEAIVLVGIAFGAAPKLTAIVLVGMPLLAIPVSLMAKKVRRRSTRSLTTLGSSVQVLSQMFLGIRTVKAFRAEEREIARYRAINEDYLKHTMRVVRTTSLSQSWTLLYSNLGFAALLFGVGWCSINLGFFKDPGPMMVFFMANAKLYSNMKRFTRCWTSLEESVGASERLLQVLEERPDVEERPDALPINGLGSGIRFDSVSIAYPDSDRSALEEFDLEVRTGETLALVGPSGGGKSTILGLICRLFDPTEGRVLVDGHDLRDVSLDDWTRLYSVVDQQPFLFHASIAENIRYGRPEATQAEIESAARTAHIHDFIASLPDGYDTNVADAGSRLSGGQRQRITIARAIVKDSPLMLLDEATSALDSESEAALQEALDNLRTDRTVIVIAHRLSTIRGADRIVVVEDGCVVEEGTHDTLLAANGAYAKLVRLQQLDERQQLAT